MKKIVLGFLAIALIVASFTLDDNGIKLEIGQKAPLTEFKMPDVNGEFHTLKSLKGTNGIIVVFSCNTCPFVVGSDRFEGWEKQYNGLAKYANEKGMTMVLINSNEAKRDKDDSPEAMKIRSDRKEYTMPYLVDANSKVADAFGAKTTPHVYMFDATLKLVYTGCVDNTWDSKAKVVVPYLEQAIREFSKGDEISFPVTPPKGCSIKRVDND